MPFRQALCEGIAEIGGQTRARDSRNIGIFECLTLDSFEPVTESMQDFVGQLQDPRALRIRPQVQHCLMQPDQLFRAAKARLLDTFEERRHAAGRVRAKLSLVLLEPCQQRHSFSVACRLLSKC